MYQIEVKHLQTAGVKEPEKWLDAIRATCEKFYINTEKQVAAFLAQTAHESGGYTVLEENLNYRAAVMATCWPDRFAVIGPNGKPKTDSNGVNVPNSLALALQHKPEKIANTVYSCRMGNGSVESGDGWKYRGRGLIQLTGKENYSSCGKELGLDLENNPDQLSQQAQSAALAAGWFWQEKNCDDFVNRDDFKGLTKRINGQTIGLPDREHRYTAVLESMRA